MADDELPDADMAPADGGAGPTVTANAWQALRRFTPARIALGRCGVSQPTSAQLAFQLAHAQARDAVYCALDVDSLCGEIDALGLPTIPLHSAARSRAEYLQRPDLGRRLDEPSRARLQQAGEDDAADQAVTDLALVVVDGLSALAVQRHATALLAELLAGLRSAPQATSPGWSIARLAVVEQGRVAIGDEIGELLGSRIVVVLIGERPGLSSPDSMGIYLTWAPRPGRRDAERNCISNVRPEGLSAGEAASRLIQLLEAARAGAISGVELKDESGAAADHDAGLQASPSFLLGEGGEPT